MEQGWDPEIRRYFKRVLYTVTYVLAWVALASLVGIYFGYANFQNHTGLSIIYYLVTITTFILLVRFLYKTWKN